MSSSGTSGNSGGLLLTHSLSYRRKRRRLCWDTPTVFGNRIRNHMKNECFLVPVNLAHAAQLDQEPLPCACFFEAPHAIFGPSLLFGNSEIGSYSKWAALMFAMSGGGRQSRWRTLRANSGCSGFAPEEADEVAHLPSLPLNSPSQQRTLFATTHNMIS